MYVLIDGVLVELAELPVDREDVHVVVLLEVVGQQVQRVLTRLQPLLILVDLLHLKDCIDAVNLIRGEQLLVAQCWGTLGARCSCSHV